MHEVVLSLVFGGQVDPSKLDGLAAILKEELPEVGPMEQVQLEMKVAPGGNPSMQTQRQFEGWQFRNAESTRVVVATRSRLNIHAVRPGQWPTGEYAGWPAIFDQSMQLLPKLNDSYSGLKLERAGVRYLNRIAVPAGSELEDWFTIGFVAPAFLADPFAINLRQTWAKVSDYDDLSATVGLAMIQIPDQALAETHIGFLLDIEIFNLWKQNAPAFGDLGSWCKRAHDVEGDVFESSITDQSRALFEVVP